MTPVQWKLKTIQAVAKVASGSPVLRRAVVRILNRTPRLKRRLKQLLARANTIVAQRTATHVALRDDDALLSGAARRVLGDLRRERERIGARADGAADKR